MSSVPPPAAGMAAKVPPPSTAATDGLTGIGSLDETAERRVDEIEMIGEEEAAIPAGSPGVTAGMRYLHCSRTIHQLVNDRNRAVGLYLGVASLLWTASTALKNVKPEPGEVSLRLIRDGCFSATFATLTILALFCGFLLIRTRIGLIYEVAKMNALLGLPIGRVQRVNPLSIFFIMHALISLAGGCSAALFTFDMLATADPGARFAYPLLAGAAMTLVLLVLYIGTVLYTTSDERLRGAGG